jgi:hypothetical protein
MQSEEDTMAIGRGKGLLRKSKERRTEGVNKFSKLIIASYG